MRPENRDKDSQIKQCGGLSPEAAAYLFSEIVGQGSGPSMVLCANEEEAARWFHNLELFASLNPREGQGTRLLFLPAWEQSPYRNLQPSAAIRKQRIKTFFDLKTNKNWILVTYAQAALQCSMDAPTLNATISIRRGTILSPEILKSRLLDLGYTQSDPVEDSGSFSWRGGIVDVFCPQYDYPMRIDFLDDSIETIKFFNPETQRSLQSIEPEEDVHIVAAREFLCDQETLQRGRERIKERCDAEDIPKASRDRISSLLSQNIVPPEMDYFIPYFQERPGSISDLIPPGTKLVFSELDEIKHAADERKHKELENESGARERKIPHPEHSKIFFDLDSVSSSSVWGERINVTQLSFEGEEPRSVPLWAQAPQPTKETSLVIEKIKALRKTWPKLCIVANTESQLNRIEFLLAQHKMTSVKFQSEPGRSEAAVFLLRGTLGASFGVTQSGAAFLSEDDIFGAKKHTSPSKPALKKKAPPVLVSDLGVGDLVVHADHGIGKYMGLSRLVAQGKEGDFVTLEYSEGDKLHVPVYKLELLTKYVSAGGHHALDKLGNDSFAKTKQRVKAAVKDIALDLLKVQAERMTKPGYAFSEPDESFRAFESEFPFDETPDQEKAIAETINDMCTARPMDRLICGDVGFGKTEVAMRAAFKAVLDGKQVAVLVPTTILAEQHFLTFSERMKKHPVRIASISRFRSKKEQEAILSDLEKGKLDILIGTHRLLSKDVKFHDLGLLVVDEEQRFGVEHKEKLKQWKATADVLTLTATPIPRTLQLSLMGLKDVSIIRTPPSERLTIKTFLSGFNDELIQSAIRNELNRGGQVFFIHNRVHDINEIQKLIQTLVPEAKSTVVHGQMDERTLEKAMLAFYRREQDVLIATAIVENGLDVPNANTIIVNRADTFGLAQLYQIRGRVGRAGVRAYAYFLVPESGVITGEAKERLAVLQRFVELGSGYQIATHDLEIRGGGDVLGQAQSGHIEAVGYEMYLELLQTEVLSLKGQKPDVEQSDVEIHLQRSALIPEHFIPDMKSRLLIYRRLSAIRTEDDVQDIRTELEDRYGRLPTETLELLWVIRLKALMRNMGFKSIIIGPKGMSIVPADNPVLSPESVLHLISAMPTRYQLRPDGKFVIHGSFPSAENAYAVLHQILRDSLQ